MTFETAEFDESAFQQEMVDALGTEHSTVLCTRRRHRPHVSRRDPHTERPILRTAPAPLLPLSRLVRDSGFKVVLTGEGADEVFAGYDIFKEAKIRRFCAAQPDSQRRPLLLQAALPYLPGLQGQSQTLSRGLLREPASTKLDDPLFSHLPRFRTTAGAKVFFSERPARGSSATTTRSPSCATAAGASSPLASAVAGAISGDRAICCPATSSRRRATASAMAHAVEGRFPFLDHRVVEIRRAHPAAPEDERSAREAHPARER